MNICVPCQSIGIMYKIYPRCIDSNSNMQYTFGYFLISTFLLHRTDRPTTLAYTYSSYIWLSFSFDFVLFLCFFVVLFLVFYFAHYALPSLLIYSFPFNNLILILIIINITIIFVKEFSFFKSSDLVRDGSGHGQMDGRPDKCIKNLPCQSEKLCPSELFHRVFKILLKKRFFRFFWKDFFRHTSKTVLR